MLVILTLTVSAVNDFRMGRRALELMKTASNAPATEWMRWGSSWLGRFTLVLSLAILCLPVLLPRGGLP